MMSSAQLDIQPLDLPLGHRGEDPADTEAAARFALKEQVAERLAAHRARRTPRPSSPAAPATAIAPPARARSARIAATVAERYAQSQTYRDFLAEEAERAIRQAEAAAQVAALNAQAVADAQYQLLAELDHWTLSPPEPPTSSAPAPSIPAPALVTSTPDPTPFSQTTSQLHNSLLTVRLYEDSLYEDAPRTHPAELLAAPHRPLRTPYLPQAEGLEAFDILDALDEEIAFRQSPVFDEPAGPTVDIPANLIEFPRQLVAARKARPRLAEGPLREDAAQHPHTAQLRIFEVEAGQISTTPTIAPEESVALIEPVWSSILLSARPASAPVESTEPVFNPVLPPQAAPLSLRLMAGVVDGCLILAAFLAFAAAFVFTLGNLAGTRLAPAHISSLRLSGPADLQTAAIGIVVVLGALALLYHLLFFTFAEATPGMIYARIGLCTLNDENPTRSAMRRRLLAMALSACPLGIGFLWACLDDDKLGWHDRISRMYQRSY